jgi:hypothetical protein
MTLLLMTNFVEVIWLLVPAAAKFVDLDDVEKIC